MKVSCAAIASAILAASAAATPPSTFTIETLRFDEPASFTNNYKLDLTLSDGVNTVECVSIWGARGDPGDGFRGCSGLDGSSSTISVSIHPFVGLGSFGLTVQEYYGPGLYSGSVQITSNGTSGSTPGYVCDSTIQPDSSAYVYGASCSLASKSTISVAVTDITKCYVNLYFPVLETTQWQENIYVTGNISYLGNWGYFEMLSASPDYTASDPLWNGTSISIPTGTYPDGTGFQYKYVFWPAYGSVADVIWEEGPNRVWTAPSGFWSSCGSAIVGQNPDVFRNSTAA